MREALHKFTDEAPRIVNVTRLPDLLRKAWFDRPGFARFR
jgi:hypothetical protein